MKEDRPAKRAIRRMWIDIVEQHQEYSGKPPLYLTMPGATGPEIDLLIERGILRQTDTGAISEDDSRRIVAVEASQNAMAELKKKFPGLAAIGEPIQSLLKGPDRSKMPEGIHRNRCQAKIVNLDFNRELSAQTHKGVPVWKELELIAKLAVLHRENPEPWYLYLTVNAGISWAQAVQRAALAFVNENIKRRERFRTDCERVLGTALFTSVIKRSGLLSDRDQLDRQRFLMAFVPKRIASDATVTGWRVSTLKSIHYGDDAQHAAMVTWIFRFDWDQRTGGAPDEVYGEAVDSSMETCCEMTADGELVEIP